MTVSVSYLAHLSGEDVDAVTFYLSGDDLTREMRFKSAESAVDEPVNSIRVVVPAKTALRLRDGIDSALRSREHLRAERNR